jgi:hypothetical protein
MNVKLPDFDPGLAFDAFESSDAQICLGVRNGNPAELRRMLELVVAAFGVDHSPSIGSQSPDDFPALQRCGS